MKWAIEIQKTSLEKRNLVDLLQGIGFALVEGGEYPALTSPAIDACASAADAFEIAKEVRSAFKGPAQIDADLVLGSVVDFSTTPPRRHTFLEVGSCHTKVTTGTATITLSPPVGLSPTELERWNAEHAERQYQAELERQRTLLEPAYKNPRSAKVIELLCIKSPSGESLYKIYELAEGHPTNRKAFHAEFGISQDSFNRFKDAVHNPSVTGDWARHAYPGDLNSANPMSKVEAEEFVRGIAKKWLNAVRQGTSN